MSDPTPEQMAECITNAITLAFGDKFIKLQEQVIQMGNHILKLQKRVNDLETKPYLKVVK